MQNNKNGSNLINKLSKFFNPLSLVTNHCQEKKIKAFINDFNNNAIIINIGPTYKPLFNHIVN